MGERYNKKMYMFFFRTTSMVFSINVPQDREIERQRRRDRERQRQRDRQLERDREIDR